jgi:hypothetical protein
MAEQQEKNAFNSYKDGLKNFTDFFNAFNGKNYFQGAASATDAFRILSESSVSGVEIYDAWLQGLHDLTSESFNICRKVAEGEKVDTECILNATSEMCENVTNRMMQAIKDTPFEAIEPSLKAVQKSTDFKNNGYMVKAILQPGIDMSVSMITMLRSYKNASEEILENLKPVSETL